MPPAAESQQLLNCIATVGTVTTGSILLEGNDITKMNSTKLAAFRRDRLGFIFQDYNLLDTLTGEENMLLPLTLAGISAKSRTHEGPGSGRLAQNSADTK